MRVARIACQDGLHVAARIWGDLGQSDLTPLLCLPGLSRNGADFEDLAAAVAPRPLVALDLVGRGLADRTKNTARYGPIPLLGDIRHVTAALGLHRVVAVGTSFGGLLAMALAVAQPTLLAGTVINDVGPEAATGGTASAGAQVWLDVVGKPAQPADWPEAVAYLRSVMPNLSIETASGWLRMAEATFEPRPDGKPGLVAQWDAAIVEPLHAVADPPDLWALFRAASARTLVARPMVIVRGGVSQVLTAEAMAKMQAAAPHVATVTIPGVGHAPTLGEPSALQAIQALLTEVDGR